MYHAGYTCSLQNLGGVSHAELVAPKFSTPDIFNSMQLVLFCILIR